MLEKNEMTEKKEELCHRMAVLLPWLRRTLDLSQTDLGEYVSISRQTISSLERGGHPMSWNQFTSFYMVFGGNQASHDILAENHLDIRDIAPVIVVSGKEQSWGQLSGNEAM